MPRSPSYTRQESSRWLRWARLSGPFSLGGSLAMLENYTATLGPDDVRRFLEAV